MILKKLKIVFIAFCLALSCLNFSSCKKTEGKSTHYSIVAEYLEGGVLNVDLTATVYCKSQDGQIKFNAYPNAYRQGAKITPLKQGDGVGEFSISGVFADDKSAEYSLTGKDENVLSVFTEGDENKGRKIRVTYSLKLSESDERASVNENGANLGNVFLTLCHSDENGFTECEYGAVGDPFVSDCANYSVKLTVPGEYVVASGIKAKSCDVDEDKTTYYFETLKSRDVAFSLNKNYSVAEKKSGDKLIKYYFYDDESSDATLDYVADALEFFQKNFGEYPYDEFAVAKTPFDAGGMEYPRLVFVADDLDYDDYILAAVHETAHQWWYGIVGNDQIKEPFLDESLAEYSTYLYFSEKNDSLVSADTFYLNKRGGCAAAEHALMSLYPEYDGKVKRSLDEFLNSYDYVNAVYGKGFLMMKAAEDAVGRKKLIKYLKKYRDENEYGIADTAKFLSSLGAAEKVVSAYLDGKVFLPLE